MQFKKKETKRSRQQAATKRDTLTSAKLEKYSNLFYLLQTEPEYLARLMETLEVYLKHIHCSSNIAQDPEDVRQLLETIIVTLYGAAFSPREEFLLLKFFQVFVALHLYLIFKALY